MVSKANTVLMLVFLQARMMMPRESDLATLAQTTVSFSMVRHPFERIVSAYEDKVVLKYRAVFLTVPPKFQC